MKKTLTVDEQKEGLGALRGIVENYKNVKRMAGIETLSIVIKTEDAEYTVELNEDTAPALLHLIDSRTAQ